MLQSHKLPRAGALPRPRPGPKSGASHGWHTSASSPKTPHGRSALGRKGKVVVNSGCWRQSQSRVPSSGSPSEPEEGAPWPRQADLITGLPLGPSAACPRSPGRPLRGQQRLFVEPWFPGLSRAPTLRVLLRRPWPPGGHPAGYRGICVPRWISITAQPRWEGGAAVPKALACVNEVPFP